MGKIRTDMERLANEVRAATTARHAGVRQVRASARGLLQRNLEERKEKARAILNEAHALGARLGRQKQQRTESARERKAGLARMAQTRRSTVRDNSARVRRRLHQMHAERRQAAAQAKRSMQQEVGGIREAVGALRTTVRKMMGEVAADVQEARRLWRTGGSRASQRFR